jgi:hypothetical protein
MKCSRCKKLIEGSEIRFAMEGDWMGKPLCRKCKSIVENESRDKYRRGRLEGNGYSKRDQHQSSVYDHNEDSCYEPNRATLIDQEKNAPR